MKVAVLLYLFTTLCLLKLCIAQKLAAVHDYRQIRELQEGYLATEQNETTCTLWKKYNFTRKACECGNDLSGIVSCIDDVDLLLKTCYCMTHAEEFNKTIVSFCPYTCSDDIHSEFQLIKEKNISVLNSNTCGLYDRTGLMCGKCVEGYAPPVYSYSLVCVKCSNYKYNWIRYIAVAYIPLTIFFVMVIVLRLPITSGVMMAYVTLSQILAAPGLITFYSARFERKGIKSINALLTFYTIWNLDFFRSLYKPFCLHPKLTTLGVISLDYGVGVYPLILITITYFLVRLHDRFRLVALIWMPVYKCLYRFRKEWNIKESLVKAFATFLILSYVKILNVSVELLTPAHRYYDINGTSLGKTFLYCNGSMEYLGKEHLPYATVAIVMSIVFNLIPLILVCSYPFNCFQELLNRIQFKQHALHIFMDSLQGCYKEQPKDYRYFSGLYIGLRLFNLILYLYLKSPLYFLYAACMMIFFAILLAVKKPYKFSIYNSIDPWLFFILIMSYISLSVRLQGVFIAPKEYVHSQFFINTVCAILVSLLPLYGISLLVYRLLPTSKMKKIITGILHRHQQELYESHSFQRSREDYSLLP